MKPILTIGLVAGAVAFLFKDQIADALKGDDAPAATGGGTGTGTGTGGGAGAGSGTGTGGGAGAGAGAGSGTGTGGGAGAGSGTGTGGGTGGGAGAGSGTGTGGGAGRGTDSGNVGRGGGAAPPEKTLDGFVLYVANLRGRDPQMNADEWNFYWSEYFQQPQTTDLFTPGDRGGKINFREYYTRRTAAGLPLGLAGLAASMSYGADAWRRGY